MSQIQGDQFTYTSKKPINSINSSPFIQDLSTKNDHLDLNDSPIPSEPLSPSSNNFLIKSQEISPIRTICSKQSPELVDINASSNNFSEDNSDNDSSELELKEEIENEKEKQPEQEQHFHLNEKMKGSSKMCLSPKKDISYSQSNCSMSQYYDTTSKYLSQAFLEEQESYENNTYKENLNKSLNFIPKQNLLSNNNKTKTLHPNDFLNPNVCLNNDNNTYNNSNITNVEINKKNVYQNNLGWNVQCFNNIYPQLQQFQNIYNNFNYAQMWGDKMQCSFDKKQPIINVQQNVYFNYFNHVNDENNPAQNSMNLNGNIPSPDWKSSNGTENKQEFIQENNIQNKPQSTIQEPVLKEETLNQSNNIDKQNNQKASKKGRKNKKRKCNKHNNPNDKSNNKEDSNEYITELFGRLGWICSQCNNFNYETRNKCNRCGIPKNPKKISELIKKKKEQTSNTVNGISSEVFNKSKDKKGDWFCPSCNNLNFGFRKSCNRCQLPRNDSFNQTNVETINHNKISVNNNIIESNLVFP